METTSKEFQILSPFDYENTRGDLFTIEQFLAYVEEQVFNSEDGHIDEVIIDGREVHITIPGWNDAFPTIHSGPQGIYTLQELENDFKGKKVEVVWYNK